MLQHEREVESRPDAAPRSAHASYLGACVDVAVLDELPAGDGVLAVRQEGEGEAAQPAHHLLALAEVAMLQYLMVIHHAVLQQHTTTRAEKKRHACRCEQTCIIKILRTPKDTLGAAACAW